MKKLIIISLLITGCSPLPLDLQFTNDEFFSGNCILISDLGSIPYTFHHRHILRSGTSITIEETGRPSPIITNANCTIFKE